MVDKSLRQERRLYFLRLLITLTLAAALGVAVAALLFMLFGLTASMVAVLVPYIIGFTYLWGGLVHCVLVASGRTALKYYVWGFLIAALPVLLITSAGTIEGLFLTVPFFLLGLAIPISFRRLYFVTLNSLTC